MQTDLEARYEALQAHIEALPGAEKAIPAETLSNSPEALITWADQGKAVFVSIGAASQPEALTVQDDLGQTALHKATKDHTGLLVRILTDFPNEAPYLQDRNKQRPLDLAGKQRNQAAQAMLFPLTYPELFLQSELQQELQDTQLRDRLQAFADHRFEKELERRKTRDRDRGRGS